MCLGPGLSRMSDSTHAPRGEPQQGQEEQPAGAEQAQQPQVIALETMPAPVPGMTMYKVPVNLLQQFQQQHQQHLPQVQRIEAAVATAAAAPSVQRTMPATIAMPVPVSQSNASEDVTASAPSSSSSSLASTAAAAAVSTAATLALGSTSAVARAIAPAVHTTNAQTTSSSTTGGHTLADGTVVGVITTVPDHSKSHRSSCHRCGNMRRKRLLCSHCPHMYCFRCTVKMEEQHGADVFNNGCPVCKDLCCCGSLKSATCTREYHCYKKCLAIKKPRIRGKKALQARADDAVGVSPNLARDQSPRQQQNQRARGQASETAASAAAAAIDEWHKPPPLTILAVHAHERNPALETSYCSSSSSSSGGNGSVGSKRPRAEFSTTTDIAATSAVGTGQTAVGTVGSGGGSASATAASTAAAAAPSALTDAKLVKDGPRQRHKSFDNLCAAALSMHDLTSAETVQSAPADQTFENGKVKVRRVEQHAAAGGRVGSDAFANDGHATVASNDFVSDADVQFVVDTFFDTAGDPILGLPFDEVAMLNPFDDDVEAALVSDSLRAETSAGSTTDNVSAAMPMALVMPQSTQQYDRYHQDQSELRQHAQQHQRREQQPSQRNCGHQLSDDEVTSLDGSTSSASHGSHQHGSDDCSAIFRDVTADSEKLGADHLLEGQRATTSQFTYPSAP